MTSYGQKVTTSKQTIPESVGVVTSDSLAGESLAHGGSFAAGNPHAAASKQPSSSTTTNTTDDSAATKLDAAINSGARDANKHEDLSAARKIGKDAGYGPTYNTRRDSKTEKGDLPAGGKKTGSSGKETFSAGADQMTSRGDIPREYSGNTPQHGIETETKTKGKSLAKNENFKGKEPNASFNSDIGTEDDPGRLAESQFAKKNAMSGRDTGRQTGTASGDSQGMYDALNSDERT